MSSTSFVEQLYSNLMGRDGSAAEIDYWSEQIDSQQINAFELTDLFLQSQEFIDQVSPLIKVFYTSLGRIPDVGGYSWWLSAYREGMALEDVVNSLLASSEFIDSNGTLDNGEFVSLIFQNALGREPDEDGLAYWVEQIDNGMSLAQVIVNIAGSSEFDSLKGQEIAITLQYQGILGINPSAQQIDSAKSLTPDELTANLFKDAGYSGADIPFLNDNGVVVDGYVAGATVFIDVDGDGIQGANEPSVVTDAQGNFDFGENAAFGRLIMSGGTDISTGKVFEGSMTAPAGSTVVNPITTLIDNIASNQNSGATTTEQAIAQVKNAFSIDSSVDLLHFDPILEANRAGATDEEKDLALGIQKVNVQVNTVINLIAALIEGAGVTNDESMAIQNVYQSLGELLESSGSNGLDLTDPTVISELINNTAINAGASQEQQQNVGNLSSDASQTISNLTQAINNADNNSDGSDSESILREISSIQIVAEEIEDDLEDGAENGDVSQTVTDTTGNNLDNKVDDAGDEVGDVDGDGDDDPNSSPPVVTVDNPPTVTGPLLALDNAFTITSNEAGNAGIYDGSTLLGTTPLALSANTSAQFNVEAQTTVSTGILKVTDSGANSTNSSSFTLGTTGVDTFTLSSAGWAYGFDGNDQMTGSSGNDTIIGGAGTDTITAGSGNDVIMGGEDSVADTLSGEAGDDTFVYNLGTVGGGDATGVGESIDGGADTDTIRVIGHAGSINFSDDTLQSIEVLELTQDIAGSVATDNQRLSMSSAQVAGLATINAAASSLTSGDSITLSDVMTASMLDTASLSGQIILKTTDVASNTLTLVDTMLDSSDKLYIDASNLSGTNQLTFDASAESDSSTSIEVLGGNGADVITSGAGDDILDGGNGANNISGGSGADVITGGEDAASTFSGDAGTDTLVLTKYYGFTLNATLNSIEVLELTKDKYGSDNTTNQNITLSNAKLGSFATINASASSISNGDTLTLSDVMTANILDGTSLSGQLVVKLNNTASNALTLVDGTLDSTDKLYIDASSLTGSNQLTFDGSAETDSTTAIEIVGGDGADVLTGGAGNDVLTGGAGVDTINGGAGDDIITGGEDSESSNRTDILNGGADNDKFIYNTSTEDGTGTGESIDGGTGTDTLVVAGSGANGIDFSNDTITSVEVLELTQQSDGSADNNSQWFTMNSAQVSDFTTINSAASSISSGDRILLSDTMPANMLDTTVLSGQVRLILNNSASNALTLVDATLDTSDKLYIDASTLTGGTKQLTFDGSAETDSTTSIEVKGGDGADIITGGAGADVLSGNDGADTLNGGSGADTLTGGAGIDNINGGAGNDIIYGGEDSSFTADQLDGGADDDTFVYNSATEDGTGTGESITGGTGTDTIIVAGNAAYSVNFSNDTIATVETLELSKDVDGNAENNNQAVTMSNDQVDGLATINATATAISTGDTITLSDVMLAAMFDGTTIAGQLVIKVNNTASNALTLVDATLDSTDKLFIDASTLTSTNQITFDGSAETDTTTSIEVLGGMGADVITGGAGDDILTGGEGADTIRGGGGNDVIMGGEDSTVDHLYGEAGNDTFIYDIGSVAGGDGTGAGEDINGGNDTDSILVVGSAGSVNFSNDAIISIETLELTLDVNGNAATDNQSLTMSNAQITALTSINAEAAQINTGDTITLSDNMLANLLDNVNLTGQLVLKLSNSSTNALTLVDETLDSTDKLYIDASAVTASHTFTFDGSNETGTTTSVEILGGDGADVVTGGAGKDIFTGGAGGDSMTLGSSGDDNIVQTVIYSASTDGASAGAVTGYDTLTQFDANGTNTTNDVIQLTGALKTALDGNTNNSIEFTATDATDGGNQALGIAGTDELINLVDAELEITVADLTIAGLSNVIAELDEEIDFSAFTTGDKALIVMNVSATQSGIYYYLDDGGDDAIVAADLSLLGIVTHNDSTGLNITEGNLVYA